MKWILLSLILLSCGRPPREKSETIIIIEQDPELVKGLCGWDPILYCHGCEYIYPSGQIIFLCQE